MTAPEIWITPEHSDGTETNRGITIWGRFDDEPAFTITAAAAMMLADTCTAIADLHDALLDVAADIEVSISIDTTHSIHLLTVADLDTFPKRLRLLARIAQRAGAS